MVCIFWRKKIDEKRIIKNSASKLARLNVLPRQLKKKNHPKLNGFIELTEKIKKHENGINSEIQEKQTRQYSCK